MNNIVRVSRAQRNYDCDAFHDLNSITGCHGVIRERAAYVRVSLPPFTDVNSGGSWWHMRLCRRCARYYGHDAELAA